MQAPSNEFNLMSFVPMVVIFVLFWFLLIRPQQKKAKAHRMMLNELKVGDSVLTQSGIYGTVTKIDDSKVALEIAPNVVINIQRATIHNKEQSA